MNTATMAKISRQFRLTSTQWAQVVSCTERDVIFKFAQAGDWKRVEQKLKNHWII